MRDDRQQEAAKLLITSPDLLDHIAQCCEQAFRRGYQQGALNGGGKDQEIYDWRFDPVPETGFYDYQDAPTPPGGKHVFPPTSALDRLQMESPVSDLIEALLWEVD